MPRKSKFHIKKNRRFYWEHETEEDIHDRPSPLARIYKIPKIKKQH